MLAIQKVKPGKGNVLICDVAEPEVSAGHVIVQVEAAGICGTDIHICFGEYQTAIPVTIGHEFAGVIVEAGSNVDNWRIGDRVTAETFYSVCGECVYCRNGRPNLCSGRQSIGTHVNGAFARYIKVPAANLHRIPDGVDLSEAALAEPLACCVRAMTELGKVDVGDVVVIIGPGPIGLLALQLVKLSGATGVVLGTPQDMHRLQMAKRLGADYVFDTSYSGQTDLAQTVSELTGGIGADMVVDCAGSSASIGTSLSIVKKAGRYCQIGLGGKPATMDFDQICLKELTLIGSFATCPSSWDRAIRLISEGAVNLQMLISRRYDLADWENAISFATDKQGLKVLLRTN